MWEWLERRRDQRTYRLLDNASRDRYRAVQENNPALPADLESEARRLAELGSDALGANEKQVRAIGERLNREGGVSLMRTVLHRAEALAVSQGTHDAYAARSLLREVEAAWDGIGDWLG